MQYVRPDAIRNRLQDYAKRPEPSEINQGLRGAIVGALNKALEQYDEAGNDISDQNRRIVLGWLFAPTQAMLIPLHSADLTPQELNGLKRWIGFDKQDGEWITRAEFKTEAWWILTRARCDHDATERALKEGRMLTMGELIEQWSSSTQGDPVINADSSAILEETAKLGAIVTRASLLANEAPKLEVEEFCY